MSAPVPRQLQEHTKVQAPTVPRMAILGGRGVAGESECSTHSLLPRPGSRYGELVGIRHQWNDRGAVSRDNQQ